MWITDCFEMAVLTGHHCSDPRYGQIGLDFECTFLDGGNGENGEYGGGGSYNSPPSISSTLQQITNTISMIKMCIITG